MQHVTDNAKISEIISKRKWQLKQRLIKLSSSNPIKDDINDFLKELGEIEVIPIVAERLFLLPESTFNKMIEKADFSSVEFEGKYCKMVSIANFPYDDIWILYISPISVI